MQREGDQKWVRDGGSLAVLEFLATFIRISKKVINYEVWLKNVRVVKNFNY